MYRFLPNPFLTISGLPNGGQRAIKEIVRIIKNRADPEMNPITFLSCTNEDEAVEWMKDAEEVAPFCAELDDFGDESREVMGDQGKLDAATNSTT
jgi:hypothetical protein